jgi:hypothetical protein
MLASRPADSDEPRLPQNAQMLRDRGLADPEGLDEIARGSLDLAQQLQDPPPGGIRESVEDVVSGVGRFHGSII